MDTKSEQELLVAAAKGDAEAQFELGVIYNEREDFVKTAHYCKLAAIQGHAAAQCAIAFCYMNGLGVEKDVAKAIRFYQSSATQGNLIAQTQLGYFFTTGDEGVIKNQEVAIKYYKMVEKQRCHLNQEIDYPKELPEIKKNYMFASKQCIFADQKCATQKEKYAQKRSTSIDNYYIASEDENSYSSS